MIIIYNVKRLKDQPILRSLLKWVKTDKGAKIYII